MAAQSIIAPSSATSSDGSAATASRNARAASSTERKRSFHSSANAFHASARSGPGAFALLEARDGSLEGIERVVELGGRRRKGRQRHDEILVLQDVGQTRVELQRGGRSPRRLFRHRRAEGWRDLAGVGAARKDRAARLGNRRGVGRDQLREPRAHERGDAGCGRRVEAQHRGDGRLGLRGAELGPGPRRVEHRAPAPVDAVVAPLSDFAGVLMSGARLEGVQHEVEERLRLALGGRAGVGEERGQLARLGFGQGDAAHEAVQPEPAARLAEAVVVEDAFANERFFEPHPVGGGSLRRPGQHGRVSDAPLTEEAAEVLVVLGRAHVDGLAVPQHDAPPAHLDLSRSRPRRCAMRARRRARRLHRCTARALRRVRSSGLAVRARPCCSPAVEVAPDRGGRAMELALPGRFGATLGRVLGPRVRRERVSAVLAGQRFELVTIGEDRPDDVARLPASHSHEGAGQGC